MSHAADSVESSRQLRHDAITTEHNVSISFRAMRALRWLADNDPAVALPVQVCPYDDARFVYDELENLELVEDTYTLDGSYDFHLTTVGKMRARNTVESYREEFARRQVLSSIARTGHFTGIVGGPDGEDFTGALTHQEVGLALDDLADRRLITGQRNANNEFTYAELTPKGHRALRSSFPIEDAAMPVPVSNHVTNYSAENYGTISSQVVGGQNHTVTVNNTEGVTIEEAVELVRTLRSDIASATAHPNIDPSDVEDVLDDLDTVMSKGLKRGLEWFRTAWAPVAANIATVYGQELADRTFAIGSALVT